MDGNQSSTVILKFCLIAFNDAAVISMLASWNPPYQTYQKQSTLCGRFSDSEALGQSLRLEKWRNDRCLSLSICQVWKLERVLS